MRTTVDLPADLHQQALAIARDTGTTLSDVVAKLMREGLGRHTEPNGTISHDELTGFPQFFTGRVITSEDVRSLEDEE
ncbi:hypothetical protein [Glycomyces arizonensis]|uniref:hypothetical protein n=1 Tax=Glycomyces arizonensis TaxID=256035 RepID=UPI0004081409|nr:hypothetical protein [Glycomyces arizonensis]